MVLLSFDIDGTLVDSGERLIRCTRGNEVDWDCFLDCDKLFMDKPIQANIAAFNEAADAGVPIIMVTGRPERMRSCTVEQLMDFGVRVEKALALIMRGNNDNRPDPEYKVEALSRMDEPSLIHCDDNEDTVNALNRNGIRAITAHQCGLYKIFLAHHDVEPTFGGMLG